MAETPKKITDKTQQLMAGRKIALLSTILLFFLALLKAIVGYRFNSPLLLADAYHSGADILINFASVIGLWIASRKKSTRFPYGLYRAETMACMVIGGVILFVGYEIFNDGLHKFFHLGHSGKFPVFPVGAALLSFIVSWVLAVKQKAVGKEIGSQALLTTAREAFFDIFTALFVLAGIILAHAKIPYVEGAVIIIISILIFKLGIQTVGTSLLILMDANMDIDLQSEIEKRINSIYGVKGVSEVRIRRAGPFKIVACIIETSPALSIYKAHELMDHAENLLLKNYDTIESVFIHVEPKKNQTLSAIIPVQDINGLNSRLDVHFGRAPYFLILKIHNDSIEIEDFYFNEFLNAGGHIGLKVVNTIIDYKIDLMFVAKIGEISFHMLKNQFVDIYKAKAGLTVNKIIEMYRLNQLDNIGEPTHSADKTQFAIGNTQKEKAKRPFN